MNEPFHQKKLRALDDIDDKDSYKKWKENDKLTLRKKHIFKTLFSKRQSILLAEIPENKYAININIISKNEEITKNPELYIKTKFDIKQWFKYLFSQNPNEIKEALYIIELYIIMQIKEISLEKRVLSRNDTELINGLCDYLNHQDLQISFNSLYCLTYLFFFPNHISSRIGTERNSNKIMEFFNKTDFNFGHLILLLLINCNTQNNQRKFFVDHGIFERLFYIMKTTQDKLEPIFNIYIIKLLNNISKLFEECKEYSKEQKINWFLPFLPFVKNTIKNSFVQNPWAEPKDCHLYLEIIKFYSIIDLKDKNLLYNIVNEGFSKILIDFYYKIIDKQDKILLLKIFTDLLSNDDLINEIFIQDGILGLFMNEINSIGYSNLEAFNIILMACANIACGAVGQINQLFMQGLVCKCIDTIQNIANQNNLNGLIKKIVFNSIYVLTQAINGCDNYIKAEIMLYQHYEIANSFSFAIKNILDLINEENFLNEICEAISNLIIVGESELEGKSFQAFKNQLIISGMEEIIDDIVFNQKINEDLIKNLNLIKSTLKE